MTDGQHIPREHEIGESEFLVLMSDKASSFIYANPAYVNASGYTWEELRGTLTSKMLHPDTPPQVLADMVATLQSRMPWTGIIKNRRKNGDFYWLRLNISPVFAKRKYAGALMVHSKVTRAEIERFSVLYPQMARHGRGTFAMRHGRPVRTHLLGRAVEGVRSLGTRGRIWGAVLMMNFFGGAWLSMTAGQMSPMAIAGAVLGLLGFTTAIGGYLSRYLVQPLRDAVRYANEIAGGDLGSQMMSERADEIGDMIRALSQMNMNMRATVVDVREAARRMQSATTDISYGTNELADRTQDQAGHLQATASSMGEINVTVHRTAETSREASGLAGSACTSADNGRRVIAEVIATMEGITKSSKKMADIIGVIDSIAFQTNILALNAAVEAARAGEQGRGFAVVAGEVRSLAQRSAQSAREIRTLIAASVDQVTNGSVLVQSAGKTIDDVEQQMRRAATLVNQIAVSSAEQSNGIERINDGVERLEEMTNSNTLMVDEHTTLAEELRSQADRLVDAVSVFKLSAQENLAMFNVTKVTSAEVRQEILTPRAA